MSVHEIIKQVVAIILTYAKPERIWLYGSQATGEGWLDMIEQRNLSSHVYNQDELAGILVRLAEFRGAFEGLLQQLEKRIATQDPAL